MIYTKNDTGPALAGSVSADLTGAAAVIHLRKPDGSTITKAATITNPGPNGSAWTAAAWTAGELDTVGRWRVEVEATFSGGAVQTFGPETFIVQDEIA